MITSKRVTKAATASSTKEREFLETVRLIGDDSATVVTSIRLPISLRNAMSAAVAAGFETSPNDMGVQAIRDRLDVLAQRVALDEHYAAHPTSRPSLAEIAVAMAELDGNPLAAEPDVIRRAAAELLEVRPDAAADDVLVYALALRAQAES